MRIRTPSSSTLQAVTTLLQPHVRELTPTTLVKALKAYDPTETPPPSPAPQMLTPAEVAEALHVSKCTVKRMLLDRRLPGVKIGLQWRVKAEALQALVDGGQADV